MNSNTKISTKTGMYRLLASLLVVLNIKQISTVHAQSNPNVRWASSGGGWRAMVADMAFANIFTQAGLFDEFDNPNLLGAISTESGASWFSAQFFYSQEFYNTTTTASPSELSNFVIQWMNSYETFVGSLSGHPKCDFLDNIVNIPPFESLKDVCNIFTDFDGDWAAFASGMLQNAADAYGSSTLIDIAFSSENRIPSLQQTDLYLQTSMVPNSRIRSADDDTSEDTIVYVGGTQLAYFNDLMYTVPVAMHACATDDIGMYYFTSGPQLDELETFYGDTSSSFSFEAFRTFGLFPAKGETTTINVPFEAQGSGTKLSLPFSGLAPTIGQIASASSAAMGFYSPLVPSTFSQVLSPLRYNIESSEQ